MFALMDAYSYYYYQIPDFCNSMCVYVKLSDLKPLMEQWNNVTENMNVRQDDSSMMEEMLGDEKWTLMKLQMKVQRLQKYCFTTSEEVQTMCAEPDMNVLHTMLNEIWIILSTSSHCPVRGSNSRISSYKEEPSLPPKY